MTTLKNFINGKFVDSSSNETMSFENPAIGQVYGTAPLSRANDVDAAFKAASDAFLGWKRTAPADRSLALIDYALRRRFAFIEIEPAFNTAARDAFKRYLQENSVPEYLVEKILNRVNSLNEDTEAKGEEKALTGILLYPTVNYSLNESYFIGDTKLKIYTINLNQAWEGIHRDLLDLIC